MGTVEPEEFCSRERENGYSEAIKAGRHERVSGRSIFGFRVWGDVRRLYVLLGIYKAQWLSFRIFRICLTCGFALRCDTHPLL